MIIRIIPQVYLGQILGGWKWCCCEPVPRCSHSGWQQHKIKVIFLNFICFTLLGLLVFLSATKSPQLTNQSLLNAC